MFVTPDAFAWFKNWYLTQRKPDDRFLRNWYSTIDMNLLKVTNLTGTAATFTFTVQPIVASTATVKVSSSSSSSSLDLGPGAQDQVSVSLTGTSIPSPGSYEGYILVNGPAGTPTLRVPYQFLVGSGSPTDIFPIVHGQFIGSPGDIGWPIAFRLMDQYGVPVFGPAQFSIFSGGGGFTTGLTFQNPETDTHHTYGIAGAYVDLGQQLGLQVFKATAGGLTVEFDGYARPFPVIGANSVMDAASFHTDYGLAPGSYVTIKGTNLSDTTQVYSTPYLPVALSTVSVSFDGGGLSLPGHLHFVSPGQINVQVPWEFQSEERHVGKEGRS